jgi:ABC-type transporter Mla maintaining outer membrane lipid asymmetry ATPase subunit MlaF
MVKSRSMSSRLQDVPRSMPANGAKAPAIELAGVVKDYRGLRPLRLAGLAVGTGERVCLSGFDGVSAEVFVNLLNGAILPDAGEVRVLGRSTGSIADEQEWFAFLDRLGIVTTRAVLLEGPTVSQNLALPLTLEIDPVPPDILARTRPLADEAGIDPAWLDRRAGEAPGHVRMRLHLARALAIGPEVLLLEHPTAEIDRDEVAAFARTVRDVAAARRLTVVAVTEDAIFAGIVGQRWLRVQPATGVLGSTKGWRRLFA